MSGFWRGTAAAAHLVIQGDAKDFQDVWAWSWKHYGEEAMTRDWSEGFYVGLRAAGYVQVEGAGRFVLESA
jgi:hypothetical protein